MISLKKKKKTNLTFYASKIFLFNQNIFINYILLIELIIIPLKCYYQLKWKYYI